MRTDAWSLACAALVAAQLLAVGALPAAPAAPWGTLFLALSVAAVALLAWIATDGRRPTLVVAGAMGLGFLAARGQMEFVAAALAAGATGFVLLWKGRTCAESSQR